MKRGTELFGWVEAIATGKKTAAAATGSDVAGFSNEVDAATAGKANPQFGSSGDADAGVGAGGVDGRCMQCGKVLPPPPQAADKEFGGFEEFGGFGDDAGDEAESKFCASCKDE